MAEWTWTMGSAIFQEMGDGLGGCLGSLRLGGCECAKDNSESGVKGTSMVQECLESGEARWR
jgi:hypothetical protein